MQRSLLRKTLLATGVVAAAVTVLALRQGGEAHAPHTSPSDGTSTSEVQQNPDEMRDHWTDRRVQDAQPAPMPKGD